MAEIQLKSLAHSYSNTPGGPEDYAIRQLDHVWHKGGAYALLGPSGCGKSTMLNIISGLVQPSEGEVLFDGKRVNELSPRDRNIAQVFQFPVIYDSMTVFDNLAFPLKNNKVPKSRIKARVHEIAAVLEIEDKLYKKAKNLTADEKQKVSMGRGLVREDVSAILFDEPLTVIDPQLKWKLRRKLKQIHEQFDITMVYVTHDQLEASTFADKIAVIDGGKVLEEGSHASLVQQGGVYASLVKKQTAKIALVEAGSEKESYKAASSSNGGGNTGSSSSGDSGGSGNGSGKTQTIDQLMEDMRVPELMASDATSNGPTGTVVADSSTTVPSAMGSDKGAV
jgi:ABC-type sugar transport system ATPase subunit